MRVRLGTTELVLLVSGLVGLVEQELVRVALSIQPSTLISGICFALVMVGAGVTVGRNFKIGPVEIELRDREKTEDRQLHSEQYDRRVEAKRIQRDDPDSEVGTPR